MSFDVVVPALTIPSSGNRADLTATRVYAERAAATWVDYFILSGTTARGDLLSPEERGSIIDLWLEVAEPGRLLACCWGPEDLRISADRGVTPMAVLQARDQSDSLQFLRQLPSGATIYSHPMFDGAVFDANLGRQARTEGVLPAGGKLAKITLDEVESIHKEVGPQFRLWDGSCRHISESLAAGAAGIVATPLCHFGPNFPPKAAATVQAEVDRVHAIIDALPDREARSRYLLAQAQRML